MGRVFWAIADGFPTQYSIITRSALLSWGTEINGSRLSPDSFLGCPSARNIIDIPTVFNSVIIKIEFYHKGNIYSGNSSFSYKNLLKMLPIRYLLTVIGVPFHLGSKNLMMAHTQKIYYVNHQIMFWYFQGHAIFTRATFSPNKPQIFIFCLRSVIIW